MHLGFSYVNKTTSSLHFYNILTFIHPSISPCLVLFVFWMPRNGESACLQYTTLQRIQIKSVHLIYDIHNFQHENRMLIGYNVDMVCKRLYQIYIDIVVQWYCLWYIESSTFILKCVLYLNENFVNALIMFSLHFLSLSHFLPLSSRFISL